MLISNPFLSDKCAEVFFQQNEHWRDKWAQFKSKEVKSYDGGNAEVFHSESGESMEWSLCSRSDSIVMVNSFEMEFDRYLEVVVMGEYEDVGLIVQAWWA